MAPEDIARLEHLDRETLEGLLGKVNLQELIESYREFRALDEATRHERLIRLAWGVLEFALCHDDGRIALFCLSEDFEGRMAAHSIAQAVEKEVERSATAQRSRQEGASGRTRAARADDDPMRRLWLDGRRRLLDELSEAYEQEAHENRLLEAARDDPCETAREAGHGAEEGDGLACDDGGEAAEPAVQPAAAVDAGTRPRRQHEGGVPPPQPNDGKGDEGAPPGSGRRRPGLSRCAGRRPQGP